MERKKCKIKRVVFQLYDDYSIHACARLLSDGDAIVKTMKKRINYLYYLWQKTNKQSDELSKKKKKIQRQECRKKYIQKSKKNPIKYSHCIRIQFFRWSLLVPIKRGKKKSKNKRK